MTSKLPVTVALITRNESRNLPACLRSVAWAEEIVVVDSFSTDDTVALAKAAGAKVVQRAFTDYADQRNYAASLATRPWVLSLDGDERASPELAREIAARATRDAPEAGFWLPHITFMFGKWIKRGGWYPHWHLRLFRPDRSRWVRPVHERVEVNGPEGRFKAPLFHGPDYEIRIVDFVERVNRYTTLDARYMHGEGIRPSIRQTVLKPMARFGYKYVWQRGWLDGWGGLALAVSISYYDFLLGIKLWEESRRQEHEAARRAAGADPLSPG